MRTTLMAAAAAWIACLGLANRALADTILTPHVTSTELGALDYHDFTDSELLQQTFLSGSYPDMTSTVDTTVSGTRVAGSNYVNTASMASILDGSAAAAAGTGTMAWRTRAPEETWANQVSPPLPILGGSLISDVVQFGGVDGAFVMQMSYVEDRDDAKRAYDADLLYLAWMNPNGAGPGIPQWTNATNLPGRVTNPVEHFHGPYSGSPNSFTSTYGVTSGDLASWAGSWGVDLTTGTVWTILNANLTAGGMGPQQFAAVPEPGTMALLAGALMMVGVPALKRWRKRRAL